ESGWWAQIVPRAAPKGQNPPVTRATPHPPAFELRCKRNSRLLPSRPMGIKRPRTDPMPRTRAAPGGLRRNFHRCMRFAEDQRIRLARGRLLLEFVRGFDQDVRPRSPAHHLRAVVTAATFYIEESFNGFERSPAGDPGYRPDQAQA